MFGNIEMKKIQLYRLLSRDNATIEVCNQKTFKSGTLIPRVLKDGTTPGLANRSRRPSAMLLISP